MCRYFFITLVWVISFPWANVTASDITEKYIEVYKDIVINEMNRTGIPASIKMAQAILESNSGRSGLAQKSNNHFGIKCGGNWGGKKVFHKDDDYVDGKLTESCFRAFDDPADSFFAHSEFLANPKSKRYKPLFQLDHFDYKGWANGLKNAGYATDPKYPQKLIALIERYELYILDYGIPSLEKDIVGIHKKYSPDKDQNPDFGPKNIDVAPVKLTRLPSSYTVQASESLSSIAANLGIPLKRLYIQNRLPFGVEVKTGEVIAIDHYIHFKKRPQWYDPKDLSAREERSVFEDFVHIDLSD